MKRMRRIACLAMTFLPGAAMAAEPVCMTQAEATSLIAYALPQAISGTAKRCAPVLPGNAFLTREGSALAARYAGQKDRYWPDAKPAFLKTLGTDGSDTARALRGLPDQSLRQMADIFIEGFVSQKIEPKACPRIDLAMDLLSPLPPENTAGLVALIMQVAGKGEPRIGPVALCGNQ